jgi:hypothetical protein
MTETNAEALEFEEIVADMYCNPRWFWKGDSEAKMGEAH